MNFKVWDKEQKRFIEREVAKDYFIDQHGNIFFSNGHSLSNVNHLFEPVFSAGFNDVNGIEVFKDDLVNLFNADDYPPTLIDSFRGSFGYWVDPGKRYSFFVSIASNGNLAFQEDRYLNIEIVGNKRQNPELL
jgi:hypothetical protein